VSGEESKDRKKHSNPGPQTNDPFKILGIDRSIDLSNPLVKDYKSKPSKKPRLAND
jgi:hypothetical protein